MESLRQKKIKQHSLILSIHESLFTFPFNRHEPAVLCLIALVPHGVKMLTVAGEGALYSSSTNESRGEIGLRRAPLGIDLIPTSIPLDVDACDEAAGGVELFTANIALFLWS